MKSEDIRMICIYCGRHLKGNRQAPKVSHGCCKGCYEKEIAKLNALKEK